MKVLGNYLASPVLFYRVVIRDTKLNLIQNNAGCF